MPTLPDYLGISWIQVAKSPRRYKQKHIKYIFRSETKPWNEKQNISENLTDLV